MLGLAVHELLGVAEEYVEQNKTSVKPVSTRRLAVGKVFFSFRQRFANMKPLQALCFTANRVQGIVNLPDERTLCRAENVQLFLFVVLIIAACDQISSLPYLIETEFGRLGQIEIIELLYLQLGGGDRGTVDRILRTWGMEGKVIPEVENVGKCQFGPQMLEYTVKLVNAHRE